MNNDNELDNEEYVLVEFDINNNNKDDHGMIIDDDNNNDDDDDDDFDDSSYVQCDEELSLNPSITASVCSETMFGELSCLQQQQRQLQHQQKQQEQQDDQDKKLRHGRGGVDTNTECVGRNRACSIVSLYDEDDHMIVPPVDMVNNYNIMDMDTEDDLPLIKGDDKNKERTMVTVTLKKGIKNARPSSINAAPVSSIITTTNQVSGSRLSNKKRRKKMKQLKKAAALAAFTAMKEQQEQGHAATVVPMTTTPSSSSKNRKSTSKGVVTTKKTTNIAVLCAREAMLTYEQGLKDQLEQQKKVNGTLNFNV